MVLTAVVAERCRIAPARCGEFKVSGSDSKNELGDGVDEILKEPHSMRATRRILSHKQEALIPECTALP